MKILFPLDGSDVTFRAVEHGLRMFASAPQAEATFLVVISKEIRAMPADAREYLEFDDEDEVFIRDDEAKAVVDKAIALAKKVGFKKFRSATPVGNVVDTIVAESARHDVMVMHGLERTEREERRRGSMTEEFARRAGCHVVLVRA